ncbi:hypothetical protein ACFQRK_02890 [Parapedobacter sp. GCM10030251]|uniref:hypothetical protein n=1 Tax=Parapedobacter sp. GCM10030251 TaxID=3273419 RepID=UPI00360EA681
MHRTVGDWGVNPWLVYIGLPLLFLMGSEAFFSRMTYAKWGYGGMATLALFQLSGQTRIRFLKQVFSRAQFWRIRLLENMLMVAPFMLFLLYKGEPRFALGLVALAVALLPLRIGTFGMTIVSTPFSVQPFEFAVGFRNSVGMLLIAYILMAIGIYVDNEHLSIATLLLAVFVCANYYAWSEPPLYVWVYPLTPQSFLGVKVRTAFRHLTVVLLPMILAVGCFFSDDWLTVLVASAVGYSYLALAVLAKYAAFPQSVSIPQGVFMVLSFVFPPLLLVSLPYFFRRAKEGSCQRHRRVFQRILHDIYISLFTAKIDLEIDGKKCGPCRIEFKERSFPELWIVLALHFEELSLRLAILPDRETERPIYLETVIVLLRLGKNGFASFVKHIFVSAFIGHIGNRSRLPSRRFVLPMLFLIFHCY